MLEGILERGRAATPRLTAQRLISEFGSIASVLNGARARQEKVVAEDAGALDDLRWFRATMMSALKGAVECRPVLSSSPVLRDYLRAEMAFAPVECFRALFLDAGSMLLRDELVATGTVDAATLYPRELISRALELRAAALILVHNHPSGDARASAEDFESTRVLAELCASMGIVLHDHLIIGRDGLTSLRAAGAIRS